jgi:hypothetical protein
MGKIHDDPAKTNQDLKAGATGFNDKAKSDVSAADAKSREVHEKMKPEAAGARMKSDMSSANAKSRQFGDKVPSDIEGAEAKAKDSMSAAAQHVQQTAAKAKQRMGRNNTRPK